MFNFKTDRYHAHVTYSLVIDGWLGRYIIRRRRQLSHEQDARYYKRQRDEQLKRGLFRVR